VVDVQVVKEERLRRVSPGAGDERSVVQILLKTPTGGEKLEDPSQQLGR
jgi:hypothetical protein